MLSSVFQKGTAGVEIFSPAGKDPFKMAACRADLNTAKFYDREIKGYALLLDSEGHQPVFQTPKKDSETLGVIQSVLCIQARHLAGKSCSIEIVVKDDQKQRRRLHFSTKFREQTCNALHAQLPWTIPPEIAEDFWVTWIADLKSLCENCFHSGFASLESIRLYGSCKLRKVFSMPASFLLGGEDLAQLLLPAALDFPVGTQCMRMVLRSHERVDQGLSSRSHAHDRRSLPPTALAASVSSQPPALQVVGTKPSARPSLQATNARLKAMNDKPSHPQSRPTPTQDHPRTVIEASPSLASQSILSTAAATAEDSWVDAGRQHDKVSLTDDWAAHAALPSPNLPSARTSRSTTEEGAVRPATAEGPRLTSDRPSTQESRPPPASISASGTFPTASLSRPPSAALRGEEPERPSPYLRVRESDREDEARWDRVDLPSPIHETDHFPSSNAHEYLTNEWAERDHDDRFDMAGTHEEDLDVEDRDREPHAAIHAGDDREASDVDESLVDDMRVEGYVRYEERLKEVLLQRLPADRSLADSELAQEAGRLVTHLQQLEDLYIATFGARRFEERIGCFFV